MIAEWMVFALAVGLALTLAAAAAERAARALRLPGRMLWVAAMAATSLWPAVALILTGRMPARSAAVAVLPLPFSIDVARMVPVSSTAGAASDPVRVLGWALAALWVMWSGFLLVQVTRAVIRVRRRHTGWRHETVDGVHVRISPDLGPAVVGIVRPEIVLPEWTLALDAPFRALMLRHEVEHRDAGDAALLFSAALLVALMPWNVALWLQARQLRLALEMDCDERVLARHGDHARYGRLLITIAQRQSSPSPALAPAPALAEPTTNLERRIRAMNSIPKRFARARAVGLLAVGAAAIAAACAVRTPDQVTGPKQSPAVRAAMAANPNSVFYSFQVDRQVDMASGNRPPTYPGPLRAAQVQGEVIAQFVVDTDGRVDSTTFMVRRSTDPRFTQAVRQAVLAYRYTPAEIQGHKVKQLVQQPFEFSLSRGAPPANAPAPDQLSRPNESPATPAATTANPKSPYYSFKVDHQATMLPDNPPPRYPPSLRKARVNGEVIAQFVVDTDGRVDSTTFKAIRSTDPLFTEAVRQALLRYRFTPAEIRGHKVKQVVQQPFQFSLGAVHH